MLLTAVLEKPVLGINRLCSTVTAFNLIFTEEGSIDGLLTNSQYVGCMREMQIDFLPVNINTVVSTHGDINFNGCPLEDQDQI